MGIIGQHLQSVSTFRALSFVLTALGDSKLRMNTVTWMKGKQQNICVLLKVENGRLKKRQRWRRWRSICSSSCSQNTVVCKCTVQNPFLEVKRTHARTHTWCTVILHTQGGDSKQVALKCYDVVRWHAKTINIYSIYTQDWLKTSSCISTDQKKIKILTFP